MENTPFLANYQDYRAQSPVREQFAMLQQQQQQHPRHGPAGSRFQTGYGSSSDDGLDGMQQEPIPRQPLQYPTGSLDHPPSSPVMSEHSVNYRASLQYPQYPQYQQQQQQQQQQQSPFIYTQGGMVTPGLGEDRTDYNRIDPYRSALSQQQLPPSSSTSSPFLGPQSLMMYHNNNNSTVSGHSQHGLFEDAPSSYDSRLSMLGQHPARSHQFNQQQQQQQQTHFPLVLLDSHRSETELAPSYHHHHHPSQLDSAGTEDRFTKQSGMEDDDDLSEGTRRARAAIIAAHQGAAGHFPRGGMNSTSQRSDAANTSGTATQDLIQGESKSSSASGGSAGGGIGTGGLGAGATAAVAAAATTGVTAISVAGKGSKKKNGKGGRHDIDSEDEMEEGQEKGALRRREPRCCCCRSRRVCVYTTFISLLVLAVVLFFVSPRVPVFAYDSVRSDVEPTIYKNHIEEPFVMRLRIDNSANWIPLSLNSLNLTMYYKLDNRKVGNNDGLTKSITFQPRQVQYMDFPMMLSYTSEWYIDLNSDGVFQDLIRACTPIPPSATTAPLGMNVQVLGKLNVWGLSWVWKPEFTIDVSNMPCPINAPPPPPPIDPEEPSASANATPTSTTLLASTSTSSATNTNSSLPTSTATVSARSQPTASS
ncbi:hypothetical protein DFQ27_006723 [Actinomortierella ambigua]|uniref:Late embryogenesis abundant protein LEA-2 subgroup domain-containing protein n=1 Tax=Actinomortierella ambigua TaxID=1343610 RepID=A0A9P6PYB1_9FUNG|nr:hypothetical protein DFQ27_006723 [Actinomortierella ambigua]